MTEPRRPRSVNEKVKDHRARLRKQGLRPVQFWLPDVRAPGFAEEARRQARAIAQSPGEQEDLDFVESISDFGPE